MSRAGHEEHPGPKDKTDFSRVYDTLYACYGPQHWWPGDTPFEVMVGAVLTQNTAWTNVEKAIANLKGTSKNSLKPRWLRWECAQNAHVLRVHSAFSRISALPSRLDRIFRSALKAQHHLDAARIAATPPETLAEWLKPSGYFNIKARRLRNFCVWYVAQGELKSLSKLDTTTLRHALLSVNGIGPETADDILLYAFHRPVFVIDAYTRRLFSRLGLVRGDEGYEALRHTFETALSGAKSHPVAVVRLFNEYHALIVSHAKNVCRKHPLCAGCCLAHVCPSGDTWCAPNSTLQ
ncbi:MAG: endonuclease III domain-containing protein [Pseudomonadota bacterium]